MKYALISDIHANLNALRAVLEDIKAQKCSHTACLGDIVGYGAQPKECLDIIRGMNIPCVKGNHDEYCSSRIPLEGFNERAAEHVQWTRDRLTDEDRQWLRHLPYVKQVAGFTLVHSSLDLPHKWGYIFDRLAASSHFVHQETAVCFFGHTHVPLTFVFDTVFRGGTFSTLKVEPGRKYLINAGSVGQIATVKETHVM